jgi:hypothetical protein
VRASYSGCAGIESGLFRIQVKHLLQFRQRKQSHKITGGMYRNAFATEEDLPQDDEKMGAGLVTNTAALERARVEPPCVRAVPV